MARSTSVLQSTRGIRYRGRSVHPVCAYTKAAGAARAWRVPTLIIGSGGMSRVHTAAKPFNPQGKGQECTGMKGRGDDGKGQKRETERERERERRGKDKACSGREGGREEV